MKLTRQRLLTALSLIASISLFLTTVMAEEIKPYQQANKEKVQNNSTALDTSADPATTNSEVEISEAAREWNLKVCSLMNN